MGQKKNSGLRNVKHIQFNRTVFFFVMETFWPGTKEQLIDKAIFFLKK